MTRLNQEHGFTRPFGGPIGCHSDCTGPDDRNICIDCFHYFITCPSTLPAVHFTCCPLYLLVHVTCPSTRTRIPDDSDAPAASASVSVYPTTRSQGNDSQGRRSPVLRLLRRCMYPGRCSSMLNIPTCVQHS